MLKPKSILIALTSLSYWVVGSSTSNVLGRVPAPLPSQPALLSAPASRSQSSLPAFALNARNLYRHAQAITVKVWADDLWGSGILIQRQGGEYWVLTNQHILWMGKRYRVQTPDGRTYSASLVPGARFGNNDLGLLRFSSSASYTVATLGSALQLPIGTPVFAAGFPVPFESGEGGFQFTTGHISLIMPKAFDGGYQVGYSNPIEKGMSGGPVLNQAGEVIAVNGMHQAPLWGNPYIFQDGSTPDLGWDSLARSSWAIPIETVKRHLAGLKQPWLSKA